jgi:uncharacterized protein (DUF2235 family)
VTYIPKVPFAYRIYKSQHELAAKFKETFSKSVEIEMLGVWSVALVKMRRALITKTICRDTVASVGLIVPQKLPFVSNDTIRAFRHCISLDEHRTKFNVTLWQPEREVTGRFTTQMTNREPCVKEMWFAGGHSGKCFAYASHDTLAYRGTAFQTLEGARKETTLHHPWPIFLFAGCYMRCRN